MYCVPASFRSTPDQGHEPCLTAGALLDAGGVKQGSNLDFSVPAAEAVVSPCSGSA
jgi:hypothetical protein